MPRAHVLERVASVQMLRTGSEVDTLRPVAVAAEVVRIVVVEDRVEHVDIDAPQAVDHGNQAVQANPGVVMDWNLEGLLDGGPGERRAALGIGEVDLGAA